MKRPWLLPLAPLYAAGQTWRSRSFDRHPERAHKLREPVISVGSLSAGGAGKTPFVIALGEALRRAGYSLDVLSRGYGRTSHESLRVRPDGTADEFGDEPLLIARTLACPVYVASERYRAGQMAETDRRAIRNDRALALHLLDDGFQHRQLARAVDIVLLTEDDVRDTLLPAGDLREPMRALCRADVIVLRAEEAKELTPIVHRVMRDGESLPRIWTVSRRSAIVEGSCSPAPLAFCGIARPKNFLASLYEMRIKISGLMALKDHQRYDESTIARLVARAASENADGFMTTAKDAVKLTPAMRQILARIGPLAVCDVQVHMEQEQHSMHELIALIHAWWKSSGTMNGVKRRH